MLVRKPWMKKEHYKALDKKVSANLLPTGRSRQLPTQVRCAVSGRPVIATTDTAASTRPRPRSAAHRGHDIQRQEACELEAVAVASAQVVALPIGHIGAYMCGSKTSDRVMMALTHLFGPFLNRESSQLIAAIRAIQVVPTRIAAGDPQTNSVAESCIKRLSRWTCTLILQAGLPASSDS